MRSHSSNSGRSTRSVQSAYVILLLVMTAFGLQPLANAASLTVTAKDPDGTNTGTARLGVPVTFTTVDTNTAHLARDWKLSGAGTYASSGTYDTNATYKPPQTMPANGTATMRVYLSSLNSVSASYTMTLINPVPVVSANAPAQLLTGGTQTLTLTGSGFVSGMKVKLNGKSYATTYISYTKATVKLPVADNATGKLTLEAVNPAPGGGTGKTFTVPVAATTVAAEAMNSNGASTNTVALGVPLTMKAIVTGSVQTAVTWTTNYGTLGENGSFTVKSMPAGHRPVTIQAALNSNPAITDSIVLNVVNPVPLIAETNPISVPAGATTTVTLTGTGFVPGTVITVNGNAVATTYGSPTGVRVKIPVGANTTGNLSIRGENTTPGGGTGEEYELAVTSPISTTAAGRLIDQTTFGATTGLITQVKKLGVTGWLANQFNTPQTVLATIPTAYPSYCATAEFCLESYWWDAVNTGNDQLRQRVALALSEIFVISSDNVSGQGVDSYVNMLNTDAFTNWYTIMSDVTKSPAMGIYLNMVDSQKATGTLIANENFARENMQLFNLGLDLLNQDGSLKLDDNGNPIPTYTQAQVQAFARVFTGWTYANQNGSTPNGLIGTVNANYYHPLVAVENYHDETEKTLLSGTQLPAGQTAERDMAEALTNIFNHPNLPPFVCKQLIQHLVKSDPSPAYISRVAEVFIDDGNGVRGDMQAVLTAIFTDAEARAGDTDPQASDGHLREPILWMTAVMRGLGYVNVAANNYWDTLSGLTQGLGQRPFQSPSVFNFFSANYVIPGTTLNAPEFGLENTASVTDRNTMADELTSNTVVGFNVDLSYTSPLGQISVNQGPTALVNELNTLFMYGTMSDEMSEAIVSEISKVTSRSQRVRIAVYLVITSSEYKVLH